MYSYDGLQATPIVDSNLSHHSSLVPPL